LRRAAAFPDTAFFFGEVAGGGAAALMGEGAGGAGRGKVSGPAVFVAAAPCCAPSSLAVRLRPPSLLSLLLLLPLLESSDSSTFWSHAGASIRVSGFVEPLILPSALLLAPLLALALSPLAELEVLPSRGDAVAVVAAARVISGLIGSSPPTGEESSTVISSVKEALFANLTKAKDSEKKKSQTGKKQAKSRKHSSSVEMHRIELI